MFFHTVLSSFKIERSDRMLKNPISPRLLKKVQMQGGARSAE